MTIFDAMGREIIKIIDDQALAGAHQYGWDGKDSSGNAVGAGIYFVHMKAGTFKETKKMAVVK